MQLCLNLGREKALSKEKWRSKPFELKSTYFYLFSALRCESISLYLQEKPRTLNVYDPENETKSKVELNK